MASLFFKYAAMNAGKTTQLIQAAFNYRERHLTPLILRPSIDNRSAPGIMRARVGIDALCTDFGPQVDLNALIHELDLRDHIDAVLIDEAQFMTAAQVMQLVQVTKIMHIPVVCYGLKTDFSGNLFVGSAKLLALADKLEELKTVCWCGGKATQNARVDAAGNIVTEGDSIEVGDIGRYVPLCLEHYAFRQVGPDYVEDYVAWQEQINKEK